MAHLAGLTHNAEDSVNHVSLSNASESSVYLNQFINMLQTNIRMYDVKYAIITQKDRVSLRIHQYRFMLMKKN